MVTDGERVQFFTEHARSEEWLSWAATQSEFQRLFDPLAPTTDCTRPLAYWFAEHCVMSEDITAQASSLVQQAGGRLGPTLWSAIGHTLHRRTAPRPTWLGPWLVLLVQNAPEHTQDWLDYALVASRWPEDRGAALMLFDYLTEPLAVLQPAFGPNPGPRLDIRIRGDDHWLREAWTTLFAPNVKDVAPELVAVMDRHLRRAHRLLATGGAADSRWDPLSFSRSAIEPHDQDGVGWHVDVLIDIARDCLEQLLNDGDDLGRAYLQAWARTDVPILRRLAVHGWVHRADVDANAKLTWLRDRGWLFDHQMRHEVFRLIETALADADPAIRDALVVDAVAGPQAGSEYRDYEAFNLLTWMARQAPDLQSAREALERMTTAHPEFQERQHPDLLAWSDSGTVPYQPPMTAESLHDLIGNDAGTAILELRSYEEAVPPFDRPTWYDATGLLSDTVRQWPADGLSILDTDAGTHPDIARAVVRGWSSATVDDDMADSILARLATIDVAVVAEDVARLLSAGGESSPTEWHRVPSSRQLAVRVWELIDPGEAAVDVADWLSRAINHPAGWLAEFWLHAISADWRAAGEAWSGLPPATRDQLEAMLIGTDQRTAMAEVVFASQLHFIFSADQVWCEEFVLPLLDWADPTRARRTWDGFLAWGRWNDRILRAGLLPQYLAMTEHIGGFDNQSRRQLCQHLASVGVYSEIDPIADGWVRTLTTTADTAVRAEWLDQTTWLLRRLPSDAVEHQWRRWMRQYWRDRLNSIPMQLTFEEASAIAQWTAYLTESMADAATLAMEHPAQLGAHSTLLAELTVEDRTAHAPYEIAALLAHLLRGTQPPFWDCHHLRDVVQLLRDRTSPHEVTPVLEEAVRLGCGDAPTW